MSSKVNHAKRSHRSEARKRSAIAARSRHEITQQYYRTQRRGLVQRLLQKVLPSNKKQPETAEN